MYFQDLRFSPEFLKTRLEHNFQVQQETIAFSDVAKVQALVAQIRQMGAAQFVRQFRGLPIVQDAFLHNLTRLFQVTLSSEVIDVKKVQSGPKRFREGEELPPLKRAKNGLLEEISQLLKSEVGDVTFVFDDGNQLHAHRPLLSYYPYWARMFASGMRDAIASTISLKEADPALFQALLHWLYTGAIMWPQVSEGREGIIEAIAYLTELDKLANRYELSTLNRLCEVSLQRLSRLLSDPTHAATFFEAEYPPPSFINPQSEQFYDVTFGRTIKANRTVLTTRCRFFEELFLNHPEEAFPIPAGLSFEFFENWVADIMAGHYVSSEKNEPWGLTRDTVFALLKLAHAANDPLNVQNCCAFIVQEELLDHMTDEHVALFCHLELQGPREKWLPYLKDPRLTVRSLKIHSDCPFEHTDFICWASLKELDIFGEEWVTHEFIQSLSLSNLCSLYLRNWPADLDFPKIPNLERICIYLDYGTDDMLKTIAENFPQLQEFGITYNKDVTDQGLITIIKNCRQLRSLDCFTSREVIKEIANSCKELQELRIHLDNDSEVNLLEVLADKCRKLKVLEIDDRCEEYALDKKAVVETQLIEFAENCYQLKEFKLDCQVAGAAVEKIANLSPHLYSFSISGNALIGDRSVRHLICKCPSLQRLEFDYMSVIISEEAFRAFPRLLKHLSLRNGGEQKLDPVADFWSHLLTFRTDSHMQELIQILPRCNNLKKLKIHPSNNRIATDSDLDALATAVNSLSALIRIDLFKRYGGPGFSKAAFERFKLRLPRIEVKGPIWLHARR